MKYVFGTMAALILAVPAYFGYATYVSNQRSSADYQIEMVNQGKWRPIHAYQTLIGEARYAEADSFAVVFIAKRDGQIMSHASRLTLETEEAYNERVYQGRKIMGFTAPARSNRR